MSFAVNWDLRSLPKCLSPSSSDKTQTRRHDHPHIFVGVVKQSCTVFASSKSPQISTDQVVKLPDVRRVLNSIHALGQSANFVCTVFLTIFGWESDPDYSLGCSLEMCSADVVVSQLQ